MPIRGKPTLCIDFDGVIHDYKAGWQGGEIYGEVTPGFFEWCEKTAPHFILTVYSSRSRDEKMRSDMGFWLAKKAMEWWNSRPGSEDLPLPFSFDIAAEKPAAWLTIDDRCVRFDGSWDDPALRPEAMLDYQPWMHRPVALPQEG